MTTEAQKRASKNYYDKNKKLLIKQMKEYYQKNKESLAKQNKEYRLKHKEAIAKKYKIYYQKNKQKILDNNVQARLLKKMRKPYHLKCKGILFCNDIHLIRKKREEQLNQVFDGQEHNFDELYKIIFKRDFNGKNRS